MSRHPSRAAAVSVAATLMVGLLAAPSALAAGVFASPAPYAAGDSPHSVILADLDNCRTQPLSEERTV